MPLKLLLSVIVCMPILALLVLALLWPVWEAIQGTFKAWVEGRLN